MLYTTSLTRKTADATPFALATALFSHPPLSLVRTSTWHGLHHPSLFIPLFRRAPLRLPRARTPCAAGTPLPEQNKQTDSLTLPQHAPRPCSTHHTLLKRTRRAPLHTLTHQIFMSSSTSHLSLLSYIKLLPFNSCSCCAFVRVVGACSKWRCVESVRFASSRTATCSASATFVPQRDYRQCSTETQDSAERGKGSSIGALFARAPRRKTRRVHFPTARAPRLHVSEANGARCWARYR